jgi:hypothetical protein
LCRLAKEKPFQSIRNISGKTKNERRGKLCFTICNIDDCHGLFYGKGRGQQRDLQPLHSTGAVAILKIGKPEMSKHVKKNRNRRVTSGSHRDMAMHTVTCKGNAMTFDKIMLFISIVVAIVAMTKYSVAYIDSQDVIMDGILGHRR